MSDRALPIADPSLHDPSVGLATHSGSSTLAVDDSPERSASLGAMAAVDTPDQPQQQQQKQQHAKRTLADADDAAPAADPELDDGPSTSARAGSKRPRTDSTSPATAGFGFGGAPSPALVHPPTGTPTALTAGARRVMPKRSATSFYLRRPSASSPRRSTRGSAPPPAAAAGSVAASMDGGESTEESEKAGDDGSSDVPSSSRGHSGASTSSTGGSQKRNSKKGAEKKPVASIDPLVLLNSDPRQFNKNFVAEPRYKTLLSFSRKKMGRGTGGDAQEDEEDAQQGAQPTTPRPDPMIDEKVFAGRNITAAELDKKAKESKSETFDVEYVVAMTQRAAADSKALPSHVLVKFADYVHPNWEPVSTLADCKFAMDEAMLREARLDILEYRLKAEIGEAEFARLYPNRWLEVERGEGAGGYVCSKRARYCNRLRSREWRVTREAGLVGQEVLYIVDWTGEPEADDDISSFKFTMKNEPTPEVAQLARENRLAEGVKCTGACTSCYHADYAAGRKGCCGIRSLMQTDEKTGAISLATKPVAPLHGVHYECTAECACDPERCLNRPTQVGRTTPMVVFRDRLKGWTLRTLAPITQCAYVGEYVGKVQQKPCEGRGGNYDFQIAEGLRLPSGEVAEPLFVNAHEMGNETRQISHSCCANSKVVYCDVERCGPWFARVSIRATREIAAGEEVTLDYFVDSPNADISTMFASCYCGYIHCRYKAKKGETGKEEKEDESDEMEENEEDEELEEEKENDDAASSIAVLSIAAPSVVELEDDDDTVGSGIEEEDE